MDMVERVARAICLQAELDEGYAADNSVLRGSIDQGMWRNYAKQARAAITAMREPTEAMLDVACEQTLEPELYRIDALEQWRAMIDAALKE